MIKIIIIIIILIILIIIIIIIMIIIIIIIIIQSRPSCSTQSRESREQHHPLFLDQCHIQHSACLSILIITASALLYMSALPQPFLMVYTYM